MADRRDLGDGGRTLSVVSCARDPDGLDEERRLCYVGITRARDTLILTWARARRRGGELRPGIESRFLRELPPALVEERRTSFATGTGGGWGTQRGWSGGRSTPSRWTPSGPARTAPPRDQEGVFGGAAAFEASADNQDTPRYVKGERVRHRRFGSGAILGLSGVARISRYRSPSMTPKSATSNYW